MRSFRLWMCLAMLIPAPLVLPVQAQDQIEGVPSVITQGLAAYRDVGMDQAFRVWLRNSPLHWEPALAAPLHQAQAAYGPLQSWEVIGQRSLANRTEVVYMV